MNSLSPLPSLVLRSTGMVATAVFPLSAHAQDFLDEGTSTTIHTELLPGGLDGKYDGEGFLLGVGLNAIYDTNLFLTAAGETDDYSLAISPWLLYRSAPSGGARYILTAQYSPFNSDLLRQRPTRFV